SRTLAKDKKDEAPASWRGLHPLLVLLSEKNQEILFPLKYFLSGIGCNTNCGCGWLCFGFNIFSTAFFKR
ncbi:MAG: hypothetical protein ABJA85_01885, partial [Bacteroidota bacterium]